MKWIDEVFAEPDEQTHGPQQSLIGHHRRRVTRESVGDHHRCLHDAFADEVVLLHDDLGESAA
ncbi:MAG: hypothetical protein ACREVJ_16540 [Gammaproteobacteria bacterium]